MESVSECRCPQLSKYLCQCNASLSDLSTISSEIITKIKSLSISDLNSTLQLIKSLSEATSSSLRDLQQDSKLQILSSQQNDSNQQVIIIKNLESTLNQILKNYSLEMNNLLKLKKTIQKFIRCLNTKIIHKEKYQKVLTKIYLPKPDLPNLDGRRPRKISAGPLIRNVVEKQLQKRFESPAVRKNKEVGKVDEVLSNVAADERTEKKLLVWLVPNNKIFYFDLDEMKEKRDEAQERSLFDDEMICLNVADKYLFCFYGRPKDSSNIKKCFILNVQTKSITPLKCSFFPKQGGSLPIIHKNLLYFFGGFNDQGLKSYECEVYNFNTSNWNVISPLSTPATFVSAVSLNDWIYLASNDFNCVKIFNPNDSVYINYLPYEQINLASSCIFLIKIGSNLYLFCQQGVYMINNKPGHNSAACEFYGAYGAFNQHRNVLQYQVRGQSAFILMATGRVIRFTPAKGIPNCSEVIHILNNIH